MPLNQDHAKEAAHAGFYKWKEWMEGWVISWTMPELRRTLALLEEKTIIEWEAVPEDVKAELHRTNPEAYDAALAQYRKMKSGKSHEEVISHIAAGVSGNES